MTLLTPPAPRLAASPRQPRAPRSAARGCRAPSCRSGIQTSRPRTAGAGRFKEREHCHRSLVDEPTDKSTRLSLISIRERMPSYRGEHKPRHGKQIPLTTKDNSIIPAARAGTGRTPLHPTPVVFLLGKSFGLVLWSEQSKWQPLGLLPFVRKFRCLASHEWHGLSKTSGQMTSVHCTCCIGELTWTYHALIIWSWCRQ